MNTSSAAEQPQNDELDLKARPYLVRWMTRVIGYNRAEFMYALLAAAWPFQRILMVISTVWIIAGLICYQYETVHSLTIDGARANIEGGKGYESRQTYRDTEGNVIVEDGASITLEMVDQFEASGYEEIDIYDHNMFGEAQDAIWWSIVTMTTVGYGDKFPVTKPGRAVGVVLMFTSLVLFSSFTATIASTFVARRIQEAQRGRELDWEDHLIVCGWNDMAPRVMAALNMGSVGQTRQVVLINEKTEESMELQMRGFDNLELRFIRGNFVREDDLKRTRLEHARAVVIVPDSSDGTAPDDVRSVEAIVTMKDMAPEVEVYVHVLDPERVASLRRAQVDDVVVTNEFVPELLANFVTKPGSPQAIRELVTLDGGEMEIAVEPVAERFRDHTVLELWNAMRENGRTPIGLVAEEEGFGLEKAMEGGDPFIVEFIKEQIAEAGITTQASGSRTRVALNPANDTIVHGNESVLVIRPRRPMTAAQRAAAGSA